MNREDARHTHIAHIGLFASIDERSTQLLLDTISTKLPKRTHALTILLNTGGGNVACAFTLYNALRALPYQLTMHNIGLVGSVGNIVFMAAEERYVVPNGSFLIHRIKKSVENKANEETYTEEKLRNVEAEERKIKQLYAQHTRVHAEELDALFEHSQLKDAEYALSIRLATEIRELLLPHPDSLFVIKTD